MKKCPFCGATNSDNSKTCYNCNENIDFEVSEERKNFESGKDNVFSNRKKHKNDTNDKPVLSRGRALVVEIAVASLITGVFMATFKPGGLLAGLVFLISLAIGEAVAIAFLK